VKADCILAWNIARIDFSKNEWWVGGGFKAPRKKKMGPTIQKKKTGFQKYF
jgi:hypothetical protein